MRREAEIGVTCQGMPKIANSNQKLTERPGAGSPSEPVVGSNPANTLILDFKPTGSESISVVLLHSVCGALLQRP